VRLIGVHSHSRFDSVERRRIGQYLLDTEDIPAYRGLAERAANFIFLAFKLSLLNRLEKFVRIGMIERMVLKAASAISRRETIPL
jgi:hypothetical protein